MTHHTNNNWMTVINDVSEVAEKNDGGFVNTLANTLNVKGLYQVVFVISNKSKFLPIIINKE